MVRVYADGAPIYAPDLEGHELLGLTATLSVEKAGTAEFVLPPDHPAYDSFVEHKTLIEIFRGDEMLFRGRALYPTDDMYRQRTITCEGERCFFRDSLLRPYLYQDTPANIFKDLVAKHNAQADAFKRFRLGEITVEDDNDYVRLEGGSAESVASVLDKLVGRCGGYIVFTTAADGARVINWYASIGRACSQMIEFGENLLDYSSTGANTNLATAILPYGAKNETSGLRVTIETVNGGLDYIQDDEAVARHGFIIQPVMWDDVTKPGNLLTKARQYLNVSKNVVTSLELTAVDLSIMNKDIESFRVGDWVPVYSEPHGVHSAFQLRERTYDLLNPANDRVVLGKDLTTLTGQTTALEEEVVLKAVELSTRIGQNKYNELDNLVQANSTAIEQTAKAIEQKANQADYDALGQQVSQNTSSIKLMADKIESTVTYEDVDELVESKVTQEAGKITASVDDKVKDVEAKITVEADKVRAEVADDIAGVESMVEQTASSIRSEVADDFAGVESKIEQTAQGIRAEVSDDVNELYSAINTSAGEIRAEVSNIQIGGRNLLPDSKELESWRYSPNKTWRYGSESGFYRFQMTESGQTSDPWHMVATPATRLPDGWYGKQITLSAYIWSENWAAMDAGGNTPIHWAVCLNKGGIDRLNYGVKYPIKPGRVELGDGISSDVPLGNYKWVRVSMTWTLDEVGMPNGSGVLTDNTHVWVQFLLRRNGSYRVYAPKLEFGNKATDWSPAPEDMDAAIAELSAAITLQAGEITSNATKIETVSQAANAAQNAANSAQGTANGAVTRVTAAEQRISAVEGEITSKVSRTEFDALGNTVSEMGTEIRQNEEEILLLAGKKSGGTQLLKNGGFYGGLSNWSKLEHNVNGEWRNLYVDPVSPNDYRANEVPTMILHAQYETGMFGAAQTVKGLRKNTQYTISGYVASHRCNRAGIEIRDTTASRWAMNPVFDVGWGGTNLSAYNRFEYTFDTGDYTDYQITLYSNNFQDNAYVWWAQVKLEEGNMATAWSDHPEEFRSGSNVTITSEEVDITTPKFEVNILSDDGETNALTINESGAVFRSVVAPNVSPRYDGFGTLYVNPNATSAQIAKGDTFRSLADALAKLSGRFVGENITINMTAGMTEYGTLVMRCVFGANIAINGNGAKIVGGLALYNGSAKVVIDKLNIDMTGNIGLRVDNWTRSELWDSVITGTGGGYGVYATNSAGVTVSGCEIYDCSRSLYGFVGGEIEGENCKGNCRVGANRSTLYLVGTMPCDSPTWAAATWAGQVLADVSVDQGSKPTPIPAPTTVTYNYTRSDSYRGGWSYFDTDAPRQGFNGMDIYGTIWFDAAAIRSALNGKTIKQASLRLFMVAGVGRGRSVVVQLYGTNIGYDGRSGRPELTTSYGTIGTTEPDMNNEMTIPTAVIDDIVSGKIQALVLKSDDTVEYKDKFYSENYARFEGSTSATTADNCPRLTVVYQ